MKYLYIVASLTTVVMISAYAVSTSSTFLGRSAKIPGPTLALAPTYQDVGGSLQMVPPGSTPAPAATSPAASTQHLPGLPGAQPLGTNNLPHVAPQGTNTVPQPNPLVPHSNGTVPQTPNPLPPGVNLPGSTPK